MAKVPGAKPREKMDRMLPAATGICSNDPDALAGAQQPSEASAGTKPTFESIPRDLGPRAPGSGVPRYFRGI